MLRLLFGLRRVAPALFLMVILSLAGCGGGSDSSVSGGTSAGTASSLTVPVVTPTTTPTATPHPPKTPVSLKVLPATATTIVGGLVVFHCTATFSDGTTTDVTSSVTWTSSAPAVATISNAPGSQGGASGVSPGVTTITAAQGTLVARAPLTVTEAAPVGLSVVPVTADVEVGKTGQLQAFAVLPSGEQYDVTAVVVWTTSAPAFVTVSNTAGSSGQVSGVSAGTATVTASGFGFTAASTVTASGVTVTAVEVSPPDLTLPLGSGDPLTATAIRSDGSTVDVTTTATWTSSAPGVATVNAAGRVQSVAVGQAAVTATYGGVSGASNVTVAAARLTSIVVTPNGDTISRGTSLQFHATGIYSDNTQGDVTDDVVWTAGPASVATISAQGVASGVGEGNAVVTAALGGVVGQAPLTVAGPALSLIIVTPDDAGIPVGYHQQYTATGYYSDGSTDDLTQQATWSAAPSRVLTISNQAGSRGRAQAVGEGSATVFASVGAVTGSAAASGIRPVPSGLVVTPDPLTMVVGMSRQCRATVFLSDGTSFDATDDVHWNSSDKRVVKVSNGRPKRGRATAVGVGTARISADYQGLYDETPVSVYFPSLITIEVKPASGSIAVGASQQFTATATLLGVFSVDVTEAVLWLSSERAVASISTLFDPGLAYARAKGSTTIRAIFLIVFEGTATLKVHP